MPIDAIVARVQQAVAESVKEAYSAGRADAAGALKSKVLELFEELLGPAPTTEHAPVVEHAPETPSQEAPVVHFSSDSNTHDQHPHQDFNSHEPHQHQDSHDFQQQPQQYDQGHHG